MRIEPYPSWTDQWTQIPGQDVGLVALIPDSYDGSTPFPVMKFTHGMNQGAGGGTPASLKTILSGPYQVIPEDWKKAIDQYGIIGVLVSYNTFFQPQSHDFVYKFIKSKYNVVDRWMEQGFSWGAGSLRKYYRSSLERANRIACTVEVSGTVESDIVPPATWENIAKANVAVWAAVHKSDAKVGSAPTMKAVNGINSFNPLVKAVYSIFPGDGHGPTNTVLDLTPFNITNGEGLTNPAENVYEWYKSILKDGARQPKSLTSTPPTTPPDPIPSTELIADFNLKDGDVITTPTFTLDASTSKGVKTGYDAYVWGVLPITGPWMKLSGGAYGGPTKVVTELGNGSYAIELTVKDKAGKEAKKKVNVTVKLGTTVPTPTPKVPINFIWPDQLVFNDQSKITVKATFEAADGSKY